MKKLASYGLAALALVGMAATASANAKWDKDNSTPGTSTRGLLDCSSAIDAGCGFAYAGNNGSGVNNVETYSCVGYLESGPENVFRFVLGSTSNIAIHMQTAGGDLDLFLLSACDEGACIAYSAGIATEDIAMDCVAPGTYYIVVDGYGGTIDSYDLSVSCVDCAPPAGNETCDTAEPLVCGSVDFAPNTAGTTNNYDPGVGNACTGYSASGGDLVWSLCVPAGGAVSLTIAEVDYDASVYLVTDCANLVGTCLDGDDCYPYPCNDLISYTNGTGGDVNAYLIIDGFAGEAGNSHVTGSFDCCGQTPTIETTWGAVKAIAR